MSPPSDSGGPQAEAGSSRRSAPEAGGAMTKGSAAAAGRAKAMKTKAKISERAFNLLTGPGLFAIISDKLPEMTMTNVPKARSWPMTMQTA